jgi:tetratricopeptide (TPR) repeat protein
MTAKLTASLRQAPSTVPALAALVLFVIWATSEAGYPITHWAPGGLIVLALLGIALATVRLRWREIPVTVRVAVGCLAAYTALSFLSILWAAVPEEAWEGADRTLLYLLVFALFACWRQRGASATLLLGAWTLALIALAAFVALHVDAASVAGMQAMLPGGRLLYPSGYPNANAAQWLMAFWPALLLARTSSVPWVIRGVLAGGAVLLAEVALLSQSRGSLYATPVMLVLAFALLAGRVRTFAVLVPVVAGVGAAAPAVLKVGDQLEHGAVTPAAVHGATAAIFLSALAVALVVALGAVAESRLGEGSARRLGIAVRAAAALTLAAVVAGGLALAGNPVARAEKAWTSFKGGYAADSSTSDRLLSGLGSNRYDFYRVALDEFIAHPLVGIGADNFQQQYLAHGRSLETPRYPHSVELRTLAQTGLVGSLLAIVGLGAALMAGARALRGADPLARSVAAAALGGFAYWVVHGSFDWFWEFAGLGAPAFALLGLACALAPERAPVGERTAREQAVGGHSGLWRLRLRRLAGPRTLALAGIGLALAAAVSLAAPWLSQLEVQSAARIWTQSPRTAYQRLDDAARLNPLGDEPYLVAAGIALRYGELGHADHEFALALGRTPGDAYATLERGAIASSRGERGAALRLLERADRLDPRDELVREALRLAREGHRIDIMELDRLLLVKARQLA